jgi:hypothetical protein
MREGNPIVKRPALFCACIIALSLAPAAALAGASTQNLPPPVDPEAKDLTPYMISLRAFDACLIVQSRLQNTTREAMHTPCSCYAKLTVKNMSKGELDAFRATGYFNESTRQKALAALDTCKLPRPELR